MSCLDREGGCANHTNNAETLMRPLEQQCEIGFANRTADGDARRHIIDVLQKARVRQDRCDRLVAVMALRKRGAPC
jgi:hypothetical protein